MSALVSSPAVTKLRFTIDVNGRMTHLRPAHIKLFQPSDKNGEDALNGFVEGVISRCQRGVKGRTPRGEHVRNGLLFQAYGPPSEMLRKGHPLFGIVRKNGRVVGAALLSCVFVRKRRVLAVALGGLLPEVRGYDVYRTLLRVLRAVYRTPVQSGDKLSPPALRFWKRSGIAVDPTWAFRLNPAKRDGVWIYSTDLDWALPLMNRLATRKGLP